MDSLDKFLAAQIISRFNKFSIIPRNLNYYAAVNKLIKLLTLGIFHLVLSLRCYQIIKK